MVDAPLPPLDPALPGVEEFFDETWYRHAYPDAAAVPALDHFLQSGDAENRSPGPDFDATFYADTYLALEEGRALRHYLTQGRRAGHQPRVLPRSAAESRAELTAALAGLDFPILLVGNDARRAGAPLLLLELSRHLRRRGWSPLFLLDRAGPLLQQFRAVGPTLVLAEGHDLTGIASALPTRIPVLANTGRVAPILIGLGPVGPTALLVHEMPDYLDREGLLPAVSGASLVVAGLPGVAAALRERLPPPTRIRTVLPGLLHAVGGPARSAAVARRLRERWDGDRLVVVGAGFADRRKGFDRFLDLGRHLHDQEPRTVFVWLGELGAWARELAEATSLPLLLPGFRVDAAAWYDNADLYLLTSRQDPGPTTVIDAARRGVPFVAAPGDLGLHSLGPLLDQVGWFTSDDRDVVPQALRLLRSETARTRTDRARHVEARAGFGRYVDDLLELLRADGLAAEPS